MLRKTQKSFNAVDVILASVGERFAVVHAMMFAETDGFLLCPNKTRCLVFLHRAQIGGFFQHLFGF